MSAPDRLRRRLGCIGRGRSCVTDSLRETLRADSQRPNVNIGLDDSDLNALLVGGWLRDLAKAVPERGDEKRLLEIARWGSVLGDLAVPTSSPQRDAVLREAALFNLGVALFDTYVDESLAQLPVLATALAPSKLEKRLFDPKNKRAHLSRHYPAVSPVVALFDHVLSSVGSRRRTAPEYLAGLISMLDCMYRSELGLSKDPFVAKRLPVLFVGHLGAEPMNFQPHGMFDSLAQFLQYFDDWQDLADDLVKFAPNAFISRYNTKGILHVASYLSGGVGRLILGGIGHRQLAYALNSMMLRTLHVSNNLGGDIPEKTSMFFWQLLDPK